EHPCARAAALLRDGQYKNAYERRPDAGGSGAPSSTRRQVDAALFPLPKRPEHHYFGAAVLGGTGVRYYGEYCLVLKEDKAVIADDTQVLDRNSYDAMFPPLAGSDPLPTIVARLRGEWRDDLLPIVKLKIL